ncbi:MAG: hypothetical protein P4L33_17325 [Capsulimonadaceae bacterium]|nr:hypothetical protein [Capsulimonadaceae bacterium]
MEEKNITEIPATGQKIPGIPQAQCAASFASCPCAMAPLYAYQMMLWRYVWLQARRELTTVTEFKADPAEMPRSWRN